MATSSVKFKVLPTGDRDLEQVQQNISDAIDQVQTAAAQAGQGIVLVSLDYTLQAQDRILIMSSNTDITVTLGAPTVTKVVQVINTGPGKVNARTADNKTDLGSISAGQDMFAVCNGKSWIRI